MKVAKRYKFPVTKQVNPGGVMHSMVTIIILYYIFEIY